MRFLVIPAAMLLAAAQSHCAAYAGFATGTDSGVAASARLYDSATLTAPVDATPFAAFSGGARVASGDINADGQPDLIVGAGPGGSPEVRIFSGRSGVLLDDYFAFAPSFTGGIFVAAGDVDGDGHADVIAATDAGGGPHVIVFSGKDRSVLYSFYAFPVGFTGGVRVAAGDVNGDGKADIIVGQGPGGTPQVRVFDGATGALIDDFLAFPSTFPGGIHVAAADLDGDGKADIIVAADEGGTPAVKVFRGGDDLLLHNFNAFDAGFGGGVRVGAGDIDGTGANEIVVAQGNGGGQLKVLNGSTLAVVHDFSPFGVAYNHGLFVAGPAPGDAIFGDGFQP